MFGSVTSTAKPHVVRGAEALLGSYGVARFFWCLKIYHNFGGVGFRSRSYCCLPCADQVGHRTKLVRRTFDRFTLNWRVSEFIKEVLLVIWFLLRSVVLYFSWNELWHLVGSSFRRERSPFVVYGGLLLLVASEGWVCNSVSHCIFAGSVVIRCVIPRRRW